MAKVTDKALKDELRAQFLDKLIDFFKDEEILRTGSGEITIPCLDSQGGERYATIKVVIPNGSRDGDEYDGYGLAEEYATKQAEKAKKKAEAEKAKAEKVAKDKARREKAKAEKAKA